jgi:hypothetical protein
MERWEGFIQVLMCGGVEIWGKFDECLEEVARVWGIFERLAGNMEGFCLLLSFTH